MLSEVMRSDITLTPSVMIPSLSQLLNPKNKLFTPYKFKETVHGYEVHVQISDLNLCQENKMI
jgi:hypothetical protein